MTKFEQFPSQQVLAVLKPRPEVSLSHSIGSIDGRCVQRYTQSPSPLSVRLRRGDDRHELSNWVPSPLLFKEMISQVTSLPLMTTNFLVGPTIS
jgi:hypothetical protein